MNAPKPCTPCAMARKFVPAAVRRKLEELEKRRLATQAERAANPTGKDRP